MTAKEFFDQQLITDANSVIDKYAQSYSRNDLIAFLQSYIDKETKSKLVECNACGKKVEMVSIGEHCPICKCVVCPKINDD